MILTTAECSPEDHRLGDAQSTNEQMAKYLHTQQQDQLVLRMLSKMLLIVPLQAPDNMIGRYSSCLETCDRLSFILHVLQECVHTEGKY